MIGVRRDPGLGGENSGVGARAVEDVGKEGVPEVATRPGMGSGGELHGGAGGDREGRAEGHRVRLRHRKKF